MSSKSRLQKIEKQLGTNEDIIYVVDPFANPGEEVSVSGIGITPHRISMEEFEKLDTENDMVVSVEFV